MPEVVRVKTPLRSTGYDLAKVRLTFCWDAGETFPLGPAMVYEGSAGGALPEPANCTVVLLIRSVPVTVPMVVGVNVIENWDDFPGARVRGSAGGVGVRENGGLGLAAIRGMVAGEVPELVTMNVTVSDWLIATGTKSTVPPDGTGMVVPLET